MRKISFKILSLTALFLSILSLSKAQVTEWRLVNAVYSAIDPDAAGPALGSVTFKLQIHTIAGSIPNINVLATGWSYQSTKAMIPTTPGCTIVSNPANVVVSPAFVTAGFAYTVVNQCNIVNFTIGGKIFDRRAVGTLDGTGITLTTAWTDVMTITMWTLSSTAPQGGFALINSGSSSTTDLTAPNLFTTYSVSDVDGTEFPVNSLTMNPALSLTGSVAPVQFSKFNATCNDKGASIQWATAQEQNTKSFEVEKSFDGNNWKTIATVKAAGNSSLEKNYQQLDINAGAAYYRLKQLDNDGKISYTSIATTTCTPKQIDMVIYPVPAKDVLNISISSFKNAKTTLAIYDATGKQVKVINENIVIGNNNIQLNLDGFVSGQYVIRSLDAGLEINKKFTILK